MTKARHKLRRAPGAARAEPLWCLAPAADSEGRSLADFMMLVPGLGRETGLRQGRVAGLVHQACREFGDKVVFVDINLRLNVLWVTVRPELGLCREVASAIQLRVPEAVLVAGQLAAPRKRLPLVRRWASGAGRLTRGLLGQNWR